jgi:hypothetical protein
VLRAVAVILLAAAVLLGPQLLLRAATPDCPDMVDKGQCIGDAE